jgi:hypothetical protein
MITHAWEDSMTTTPPGSLDAISDEFNKIIGQCITQWALVEEELFQICWRILQSALEHAAIIYYRTPTLDARLSLATELVESIFPNPKRSGEHAHDDLKLWRTIEKEFRKQLEVRNRMAHHPVWPTYRLSEDRFDISGFEIYASQHERHRGRGVKPPLRVNALRSHLMDTNQLVFRLIQFRGLIVGHAQAFVSQAPRPIPRIGPEMGPPTKS